VQVFGHVARSSEVALQVLDANEIYRGIYRTLSKSVVGIDGCNAVGS